MSFLKKYYKIILVFLSIILLLYILPIFVNLNSQKSFIEKKIEDNFGFRAVIKGDVSFTILPKPALILKTVEIRSKDTSNTSGFFINAPQIFINTGFSDIFSEDTVFNRIGIIDASFYANAYKSSKYENLDMILNGKTFKEITLKNSRVVLTDSAISNINMTFTTLENEKIKGVGSFSYKSGTADDLSLIISYLNKENYNIISDGNFSLDKNKVGEKFTFVMKDGEKTFSGDLSLSTDNLSNFFQLLNFKVNLPETPFFNEKLNLSATIQHSVDSILINNGSFEGDDISGKFKGKIPFVKDSSNPNSFNIDFTSLPIEKMIKMDKTGFKDPINLINNSKTLLSLLQYGNFTITAKNFIFRQGVVNDLILTTSPLVYNNQFNGLDIKNLSYNFLKKPFSLTGKMFNILNDLKIDASINSEVPFSVSSIFNNRLLLNKFSGNIGLDKNNINITNASVGIGKNTAKGSLSVKETDKKTTYQINLTSDDFDITNITSNKIDLSFIISKLSLLKDTDFSLSTNVKSLKINKNNYNDFKLDTSFTDGNLMINSLTFKTNDYSSQMKGELFDLLGSDGEFRNFNYKIYSSNLRGISIPFISNSFIDKMISNGVNKIDIVLNGSAKDPVSQVDATLNNIKMKINGHLLNKNNSYTLELSHNELKGFLFSWGFIPESLLGYFYDDIPFKLKATMEKDNIKDIQLEIKNNKLTGEVINQKDTKGKTIRSVKLTTPKFDIKGVIKRIKNTDGYLDLILKIIRGMQINLDIQTPVFDDYDGNSYQDFSFNLKNATNPGKFIFNLKKSNYKISLDTEILNNSIFEGKVDISNYTIPNDIMQNDLFNLRSGILDAKITFKTNGGSSYQLLSNLNGKYETTIKNGTIEGISNYTTILSNILSLANITTNNVIYVIENSVQSGILDFTNLNIKGDIDEADVKNSGFTLASNNMNITGTITGNLIQKSLNIESVFDIKDLAPNSLIFMYNLNGFINNLTGNVNTSGLTSEINPVYLQRKKK